MSHLAALLTVLLVVAHKSQAQSSVAEGYFVVDDKAVQRYVNEIPGSADPEAKRAQALANINVDIEYFLTEINELFKTLQPNGLNLQITKRSLDILNTNLFTTGFLSDGLLLVTKAVPSFRAWLEGQNAYATLNFDFAILWTGYDLYGGSGADSVGTSYAASICDNYTAIGVVEFSGTYATVRHTIKYISLILGAGTDGAAVENVLRGHQKVDDEHRWEFSSCSAVDIKAQINTLSTNCLLQTSSASTIPSTSWSSYPGQLFDPDVICQRSVNDSRSYMGKFLELYENQVPTGDIICKSISCWIPGPRSLTFKKSYPSEGLVCNPNSRCDNGVCTTDSSSQSSNVEAGCVHGDQKRLFLNSPSFNGTCAQFISQYGKEECYNVLVRAICCATCKTQRTGPAGCEYGDRATNCAQYSKSSVCPQHKDTLCCDTCQGFVAKRSVFGLQYNASLVLEVKDPVKVEVTYETVHESIEREVE